MRVVRLLSALGDFAFRELTVYFNKINPLKVPEYVQCHLNVSDCFYLLHLELYESLIQFSAIYLRGRSDIFFHEYLNDVCGDGLLPFMLYFSSKFTPVLIDVHLTKEKIFQL